MAKNFYTPANNLTAVIEIVSPLRRFDLANTTQAAQLMDLLEDLEELQALVKDEPDKGAYAELEEENQRLKHETEGLREDVRRLQFLLEVREARIAELQAELQDFRCARKAADA